MYSPTWVEQLEFLGTLGFFFTFYLLFVRFLPTVSIAEVKMVASWAQRDAKSAEHGHGSHVTASGPGASGLNALPAAPKEGVHHG